MGLKKKFGPRRHPKMGIRKQERKQEEGTKKRSRRREKWGQK
jgi:hypothetical protein